ncbi:hypothetical protein CapIbe_018431 [Capra ibex]
MGTSSGLGFGALGFLLHLGQLLSACPPSWLHGHWSECAGNWSVFRWCFCSGGTLTVFMVELCGRQSHFPLSCYDVLYHCAFYFTLFCLFASIIFTTNYVRFLPQSHTRNQAIAATAFSCISTIINCHSRFQYTSAVVRQTILCSDCFSLGMTSTLLLKDDSETRTPAYCPLL